MKIDRTEKTITTIKISLDWLKSRVEMTKHRIMNLRIDQQNSSNPKNRLEDGGHEGKGSQDSVEQ